MIMTVADDGDLQEGQEKQFRTQSMSEWGGHCSKSGTRAGMKAAIAGSPGAQVYWLFKGLRLLLAFNFSPKTSL
jgi:hypothetical protein